MSVYTLIQFLILIVMLIELAAIMEYLEHDEWGLDLEHLSSTIIEEGILIPEPMFNLIKKIGDDMELESMNWLEDSRN